MFRWFDFLLLLFCLGYHSGTITRSASEKKGGNVTLTCEYEEREIFDFELTHLLNYIPVCQKKNCSGRVFKQGNCSIIIKDLNFSDAGRYILHVYYQNDQTEQEQQIIKYQLHIHDDISVKIGRPLNLDVLLSNAYKVETNSSGKWTEVWKRGSGVQSKRMTDSDGNLIIGNFTASDAGTYIVLDSEGEILITVTVTEFSTGSGSTGNLNDTNDTTQMCKQPLCEQSYWILCVGVLVLVVVAIVFAVIMKQKPWHKGYSQPEEQGEMELTKGPKVSAGV